MIRIIACVFLVVLVSGCSKEDGKSGASESPASESPASPSMATLDLGGLGLTAQAPSDAKARKFMKKFMIKGKDLVVTVGLAGRFDAATLEAATKEATGNGGTQLVPTKLADGFVLTYQNTGSAGTNYWVSSHQTLNGKNFVCGTTVSTPAQQANAAALCQSLKVK